MKDLLEPLTALVVEAGEAINAVRCGTLCIDEKSDGSPVTQADLAADRILIDGLARLCPDIPTLSEERTGAVTLPLDDSFFLVDPLDGTKEFVAGRDEFTVNLALVVEGAPVLGIVGAPGLAQVWRGISATARSASASAGAVPVVSVSIPAPPPAGTPWRVAVSRFRRSAHRPSSRGGQWSPRSTRLGTEIRPCRGTAASTSIRASARPRMDVGAGLALVIRRRQGTDADGAHCVSAPAAPAPGAGFIAWRSAAARSG